uniref:Uncharacterized protein TCIL3000_1_1920 n=1 Tax=Trypanosoma congolense (strain IL3000) TaxID=1068625 RepID=G0UJ74_TRYCI|nr:unnamed protein product [Trypanosoma congolense IL3000]
MEDLRIRGNAVFPTDLQSALALYQEAITLYEKSYGMEGKAPTSAVEEYTRCTGNALTCLFKLEQFSECATLAIKALRVNPLMSKAYAFIGRCMLVDNSSALCKHRREMGPLQYLCRAVYLQPSMAASVVHLISESIDRLLEETYAAQGGGTNSNGNIGAISSNARESGVNTNENGEVDSNVTTTMRAG